MEETNFTRPGEGEGSRLAAQMISWISNKKLAYGLLVCLLVYVVIRSLFAAAAKPFWFDEMLTVVVSSQGSWKHIVGALAPKEIASRRDFLGFQTIDSQPPLFYVIEHFASSLVSNKEVAYRLPSILALLPIVTCVFLYVKKRAGELVALLCATLLLMTNVFQTYAVEARPYSMELACFAFALLCYQRAPSPIWTALLAISLALAEALHYYAVLAMIPFGLAEAVVLVKTRRFRWAVWSALAFGPLPLLLQWKLLINLGAHYDAHFWAHLSFTELPKTYGEFFLDRSPFGGSILILSAAAIVWTYLRAHADKKLEGLENGEELAEVTPLGGFLLLPFIAYFVTKTMHSPLTMRYVLTTVLAFSLALGYSSSRTRGQTLVLAAIFVLSSVGDYELHFWRSLPLELSNTKSYGARVEKLVNDAGCMGLPIVVPLVFTYVPLVYYAPPHLTSRFVFLPTLEGWDSTNRETVLLQNYWPLHIDSEPNFISTNNKFLVLLDRDDEGRDWFTGSLSGGEWSLRSVATNESQRIYLVTRGER